MILSCRFNYRTNQDGVVFNDVCTVGETYPYLKELTVDDIIVDLTDYSAEIHCHDNENKRYTLYQRNIHSFIEQHQQES